MKKCPKCGTILDDSKKKCYMCGTELSKTSGSFAENFDIKIGAQTSKGQDNVFNNGKDLNAKGKDMFGKPQKGIFFSDNSSASGVLSNSSQFGGKKKDNEVDSTITSFFEQNSKEKEKNVSEPIVPAAPKEEPKPVKPVKEKKAKQKTYVKKVIDDGSSDKINFNIIFNVLSIIMFLGLLIFGYIKFVKPKNDANNVVLGELSYVMDSKMELTQDEKYDKYYTRGDSCAIKVSYGKTADVDGFVDNYFDRIREEYSKDNKHLTRTDQYKLNGNTWEALTVLEMVDNPAATGGFSTLTKYRYITIVQDGKYYTVVYANTEDDAECSNIYEKFINTLKLKK